MCGNMSATVLHSLLSNRDSRVDPVCAAWLCVLLCSGEVSSRKSFCVQLLSKVDPFRGALPCEVVLSTVVAHAGLAPLRAALLLVEHGRRHFSWGVNPLCGALLWRAGLNSPCDDGMGGAM